MNWQTEEVFNWLEESEIDVSSWNSARLEKFVKSELLEKPPFKGVQYLRNNIMEEFLCEVEYSVILRELEKEDKT